ncbi:Uncharacterised protein [Bordetella pertussis]|nr:Uncharacterised protein [Bordetella pertussis]
MARRERRPGPVCVGGQDRQEAAAARSHHLGGDRRRVRRRAQRVLRTHRRWLARRFRHVAPDRRPDRGPGQRRAPERRGVPHDRSRVRGRFAAPAPVWPRARYAERTHQFRHGRRRRLYPLHGGAGNLRALDRAARSVRDADRRRRAGHPGRARERRLYPGAPVPCRVHAVVGVRAARRRRTAVAARAHRGDRRRRRPGRAGGAPAASARLPQRGGAAGRTAGLECCRPAGIYRRFRAQQGFWRSGRARLRHAQHQRRRARRAAAQRGGAGARQPHRTGIQPDVGAGRLFVPGRRAGGACAGPCRPHRRQLRRPYPLHHRRAVAAQRRQDRRAGPGKRHDGPAPGRPAARTRQVRQLPGPPGRRRRRAGGAGVGAGHVHRHAGRGRIARHAVQPLSHHVPVRRTRSVLLVAGDPAARGGRARGTAGPADGLLRAGAQCAHRGVRHRRRAGADDRRLAAPDGLARPSRPTP